jgi:plastocyanin
MAGIVLSRPAAATAGVAAAPTAIARAIAPTSTAIAIGPTAAPTAAPVATTQPRAIAPVRLVITDNSYSSKSLSVPVGATVVWSHEGQRPHTVTADDDSFKSELLKNGRIFEHTFSQPGTFLYYCELHGGAGGEGMSARVQVQ